MLPYQLIFHPENYYTLKKKKKNFSYSYKYTEKNRFRIIICNLLGLSALQIRNISLHQLFLKCYKESQLNIKRLLLATPNAMFIGTVCLIH